MWVLASVLFWFIMKAVSLKLVKKVLWYYILYNVSVMNVCEMWRETGGTWEMVLEKDQHMPLTAKEKKKRKKL